MALSRIISACWAINAFRLGVEKGAGHDPLEVIIEKFRGAAMVFDPVAGHDQGRGGGARRVIHGAWGEERKPFLVFLPLFLPVHGDLEAPLLTLEGPGLRPMDLGKGFVKPLARLAVGVFP